MLMAPPASTSPGTPTRGRRKSASVIKKEHLTNIQPVLAITLTNGGRTTITRAQLQANSTSTDGFWIDLGDSHEHSHDSGNSSVTGADSSTEHDDAPPQWHHSAKGSLHISCTVREGHMNELFTMIG